jgi:hypothetical protein
MRVLGFACYSAGGAKVVQQMDPEPALIRPMTRRAQYDLCISGQIHFASHRVRHPGTSCGHRPLWHAAYRVNMGRRDWRAHTLAHGEEVVG